MSSMLDEVLEGFAPSPEIVSVMAGSRQPVILGLDVGTSGMRAALFDEQGQEIDGACIRLRRNFARIADFAELDAEATVDLVAQTIDALLALPYQFSTHIELIAVSCFWHSLVGVNAEGWATTPVLGWAERRAADAANQLRTCFDEREIHRRTGCRFHSSYWPAKLLWLREERPDAFKATHHWLSFGEYLTLRLVGYTAASVSMASGTGLLNQHTLEWDTELMEGLRIRCDSLPKLSDAQRTFPGLTSEYALRWPQLSDACLLPAIGDGAANNIGSGCNTRERAALMIGTSGAMRVLYEGEPPDQIPPEIWCYRADRARVVIGGALSDGGGLYGWIRELLLSNEDAESIEGSLAELEPDAHGLTVLPFWAGERSTGWSATARGAIIGLTFRTRPIEILRAAMEAVAYRFALIARALEPLAPQATIIASGNSLRSSAVWGQIIADVLGRPVMVSAARESSTRGAALLALEAAGKIRSIEGVSVPVERAFEPDMPHHARYQQALERQEKTYERLISDW